MQILVTTLAITGFKVKHFMYVSTFRTHPAGRVKNQASSCVYVDGSLGYTADDASGEPSLQPAKITTQVFTGATHSMTCMCDSVEEHAKPAAITFTGRII